MELNDFFNNFSDEQSCRAFFKQQREARGIVCRQCGSVCHYDYWIEKETRWRCKDCKQPMGLKSGTVMDAGKDYLVFHAYDANDNGKPKLRILQLQWDNDAWPAVANENK